MFSAKVAIAFIALSMGSYTLQLDDNTQQPALSDLIDANMAQSAAFPDPPLGGGEWIVTDDMEEFLEHSHDTIYEKTVSQGYDFDLKMETTLTGNKVD